MEASYMSERMGRVCSGTTGRGGREPNQTKRVLSQLQRISEGRHARGINVLNTAM